MLPLKKIRLFLAIVIILAGATLVATVMLKFEKVGPPPQALEALPKNVDMALHKVHYSEVQDGEKNGIFSPIRLFLTRLARFFI